MSQYFNPYFHTGSTYGSSSDSPFTIDNGDCGGGIHVIDSPTVHLTGSGNVCYPLSVSVKISANAGNSIVANADGLYSSGGSGGFTDTGSLLPSASFKTYTASNDTRVNNIFASESNYLPTSSFQTFSASVSSDSSSFNTRIISLSGSSYNPAQLNSFSASILNYTGSINIQIQNVFSSESNYTPTSSFNSFSASYVVDSASILTKIGNATYNAGQLNAFSASILNYTGSVNTQVANVYASESNYLPTASFNTFSASYHTDSASFDSRINSVGGGYNPAQLNAFSASILTYTGSVNTQLVNIFASQSNYALTSSLNTVSASLSTLSSSVSTLSGSLYTKINNVFASESNYTLSSSFQTFTASFNTFSASYVVDSSSFLTKIANATYNPAQLNAFSASVLNFTGSIQTQVNNTFASESNYTLTSSFLALSSSYHTDSASFDSRINSVGGGYNPAQLNAFSASILTFTSSINSQVANVYSSESNYLPTASFTPFSASYVVDSASFNTRINSAGGSTNTGSLLLTSSFNAYTASNDARVSNILASESNYLPTSSFVGFSSSYVVDSASFLTKINAATYNPSQLNAFSASILTYTGSETAARINTFASQSNYTLTSSFNSFSASYVVDSASLLTKITNATYNPAQLNAFSASILIYTSSVNTQLTNIFASESNYTPTSSFNTISASAYSVSQSLYSVSGTYHTDSASFYIKINNVFASESNYVPTASYNPFTASYFADSSSFNTRINSAGGGSSNLPFSTQNNSYTLVLGDANTGILMNSGSAMILTVPSSSTVNFPTGSQIVIEQAGAGAVTITPIAGVTLQGTGLVTAGQFSVIVLIKQASDIWFVGTPDVSLSGNNTWTGNQTFSAGAFDLAAGTVSQPAITFVTASAVLMTASLAGSVEVDSNGIQYYTYQNGSRGVSDTEQFVVLTGSFTMVSQTAAQRMFPAGTDELAVRGSTSYFFEAMFSLSTLSATAGTFGFNLSGSATLTSQGWTAIASKAGAVAIALNVSSSFTYNTAANTALTTNSVVTTGMARINGIIRTNAAGTLVPAISLSQASAAVVGANSYFRIWPVGTSTVQSVGNFS